MGEAAGVFGGVPEGKLGPVRGCYKEQQGDELPEGLPVIVAIESHAAKPGIMKRDCNTMLTR